MACLFSQFHMKIIVFSNSPLFKEDIKEVICISNGNKSPRPDGFNFNFYKSCWDIFGDEVYEIVQQFCCHLKLPKGLSASFFALIPKHKSPQILLEYRPISLIGNIYKFISKLLASRLKRVLNSIISQSQYAFLPSRQTVINEIVDWTCKSS